MENLYFGSHDYILLFLTLPAVVFLAWQFIKWRKSKRFFFAEDRFHSFLFDSPKHSFFLTQKLFLSLFFVGITALIIAIIDIVGAKETKLIPQKTNNILFAIDVSNSMNTEDILPNRLTMAKNILINTLSSLSTDRVGIIVFAGEAKSIMPLTTDYSGAEFYIEAIETSIIKNQGTDFLNAIKETTKKFKNIEKGNRTLVLLSDGEDNEENTQNAIKLAQKEGISVISIGIGTDEGAPVPEYLMGQLIGYKTNYDGETILSQRKSNDLKLIAKETSGNYIEGNTVDEATQNLKNILQNNTKKSSEVQIKSENYEHYYQYPLAISLACFFFIFLLNPKRDLEI